MQDTTSLRTFCTTLNNYTTEEFAIARDYASKAKYAIIGRETGEGGTPHLQSYFILKSPAKFRTIKKRFPRAHIEKAKGDAAQNKAYCSKEGQFEEFGTMPAKPGERTELDYFKDAVKQGITHNQALEEHSNVCARYPKFVREYETMIAQTKIKPFDMPTPRQWQSDLIEQLQQEPDDRTILWVVDYEGGKGKTFLAKHLVSKYNAFYTNGGKSADIFYAYQGQRIAIFDFVRETQDFVNYGALEAIKNGLFSSNKYESITKHFDPPHVLVLANFEATRGKLSEDRLKQLII